MNLAELPLWPWQSNMRFSIDRSCRAQLVEGRTASMTSKESYSRKSTRDELEWCELGGDQPETHNNRCGPCNRS